MLNSASFKVMTRVTLTAPAKINLTLDILGKREDGYHFVKMIMQTINLFDTVKLTSDVHKQIKIFCDSDKIPIDNKNLAFKATNEFFKQTGSINPGINITISKKIPISAGLAGGSTDAAAVIIGLNHIFNTKLSPKELCNIGANIGADVPFCILGGTVSAEGIGTILTPLPDMPNCYIVLAKPPISISTKDAYNLCDTTEISSSNRFDLAVNAICNNDIYELGNTLYNRFEAVLNLTEVDNIKKIMFSYGAIGSCMSGSGPSVFAFFDDENKANNCIYELKQTYNDVYLCSPINTGCVIVE